jgi:hypothetical protein
MRALKSILARGSNGKTFLDPSEKKKFNNPALDSQTAKSDC